MHLCVKTVDVAASRQEGCVIFEYIVALNMVIITFVITNRLSNSTCTAVTFLATKKVEKMLILLTFVLMFLSLLYVYFQKQYTLGWALILKPLQIPLRQLSQLWDPIGRLHTDFELDSTLRGRPRGL